MEPSPLHEMQTTVAALRLWLMVLRQSAAAGADPKAAEAIERLEEGIAMLVSQAAGRVLRDETGRLGGTTPLAGVSILIVEDEPSMRDGLAVLLTQLGARATATATAEAAFEALCRDLPSVLIADVKLGGDDGFALVRRIRALPPERGGALPAIALTGSGGAEDRAASRAAGFDIHLVKPPTLSELIASVLELSSPQKQHRP
jgi:CheY-like chemotaxis protein